MGDEAKSVVEMRFERLEECVLPGPGRQSLEDRMRIYVDTRDNHKERNLRQEMLDLRNETTVRHAENTSNFGKIFKWMDQFDGALAFGKVVGSVIAFLCMAILALLGYLAASRSHSTAIGQSHAVVSQNKDSYTPSR